MKGSVKLPVFIDDIKKRINTLQMRGAYQGAQYEAEYCNWLALRAANPVYKKASLIVTPNSFKESSLLSIWPPDGSGDMTFSRASTGTRVNSQGLIEVVPYNYILGTEEFSNSSLWSYYISNITANTTTAPNGTLTADTIAITGTNGSTYQSVSGLNANIHTLSAYYKKTNEDNIYMDINTSGGYFGASFNLTTLATTLFGGGFSPLIESVGNGWYRCSVQGFSSGSGAFGFGVYAGSGQSAYIWGAQLNEGSLKDYFPISSTRNNFPRLDYSNGSCPFLLLEPQRTNLNTYSEDLTNAWYSKFNSSISANSTTSPSGIANADKIIENTNNNFHYVETANTLSAGSQYTISAYLKKAERDFGYIGVYTFESKQIRVNLVNGTIENTTGTWLSTSIEDAGNGWYRVSGTFDAYATSYFFSGPALNATTVTYTGDGISGIYVWGAQLEAGSYATLYIPTTSTSVTRVADVCSKTGISSLIGQTEGVIFYDFELSTTGVDFTLGNLYSSSNGNSFSLIYVNPSNAAGFSISNNGVTQCEIVIPTLSLGRHKIAFAYKANDFAVYVDGIAQGTDTSGTVPAMDNFNLRGFNIAPSSYIQRTNINYAILFKERLSNAELAQLTTI